MAPKTKFSREELVEAAFVIAKTEGVDQITVRKVADQIGSSVAPIYVNFSTIDELKEAVLEKIQIIANEMLQTSFSSDSFLNIGIASLKFAREYPVLFNDLILNQTNLKKAQPHNGGMVEQLGTSSHMEGLTEAERMDIFFKMQIFQLGLSVMDVNGFLPKEYNETKLIALLESAGQDMIAAARLRKEGS